MTPYVAVVGAGIFDTETGAHAEEVGVLLGEAGAVVLCGGLTGVMESVCRGARSTGGTTVGILPGHHRNDANEFVDVAVATGMGEMRNALIVRASDAVIAIGGEFGTLSEVAFALKIGRPVVGLDTWHLSKPGGMKDPIVRAESPADAVSAALRLVRRQPG